MTDFKGFTKRAGAALNKGSDTAMELGHTYIGSEHILYGLLCEEGCAAYTALDRYGIHSSDIMRKMELTTGRGVSARLTTADMSPRSRRILENALRASRDAGRQLAGTEHILLSVLNDESCCAAVFLKELGADVKQLARECAGAPRNCETANAPDREYRTCTLGRYGRDLTALARSGGIDPVSARDREIAAAVRILLRRRKNNPCLIGESGVGKTAVAEGIALAAAAGTLPEELRGVRIFSLDIPSMVAGAKYRGDFEERIRTVLDEVSGSDNTVLFIDEIHTIVGAGAAEGAIDAANILKPALARGEIRVIGATTADEYRRYIEKDAALARRFRPVYVEEPDEAGAAAMLRGLRPRWEKHHGVTISDGAIDAAVKLSVRYIEDRRLPDKAIDLIDESCTAARMRARGSGTDEAALRLRLNALSVEKENAVLSQDFERAAGIRDLEREVQSELSELGKSRESNDRYTLTAADIAAAVSDMTGIPAPELGRDDPARVTGLAAELKKRVIGQDAAIDTVVSAIKRSTAGISRPDRPIGSFIFAGPTGVGKTELSKALSRAMFGKDDALIRFDMSEYMEKHSISGLIGAPAGYVGYEDGGRLIQAVKRRPYSVLLFDEIEKAHPDIPDLLLQALDEGHLTSADGVKVSLKHCIIIMTTNIGSSAYSDKNRPLGFISGENDGLEDAVRGELRKAFRPEFINRADGIAVFRRLGERDLELICRGMTQELAERAKAAGVGLTVTDEAVAKLARSGSSELYGARELYRTIVRRIEEPLADMILSGAKSAVFGENDV